MGHVSIFAWIIGLAGVPAAAEPEAIKVAFDFLHNQIVLHATVQGQGPFNFILDTGTYTSAIDLNLARQLRLPLGPEEMVVGAGNSRKNGRATLCQDVRLGDLVVRDLTATAIDLADVRTALGRSLHGVLGYSFLRSRVLQIDYFRRQIRFLPASPVPTGQPPDDARSIWFPMVFREKSVLPVLHDFYVNGVRVSITLDTGSSLGLVLFPSAIDRLGLRELARAGIPMRAAGYLGHAVLTKGWVTSVKLKTIDLGAVEVAYVQTGFGQNEELEQRAGNIGNAVLQDFVLTLDYPGRMVKLESTAE